MKKKITRNTASSVLDFIKRKEEEKEKEKTKKKITLSILNFMKKRGINVKFVLLIFLGISVILLGTFALLELDFTNVDNWASTPIIIFSCILPGTVILTGATSSTKFGKEFCFHGKEFHEVTCSTFYVMTFMAIFATFILHAINRTI